MTITSCAIENLSEMAWYRCRCQRFQVLISHCGVKLENGTFCFFFRNGSKSWVFAVFSPSLSFSTDIVSGPLILSGTMEVSTSAWSSFPFGSWQEPRPFLFRRSSSTDNYRMVLAKKKRKPTFTPIKWFLMVRGLCVCFYFVSAHDIRWEFRNRLPCRPSFAFYMIHLLYLWTHPHCFTNLI